VLGGGDDHALAATFPRDRTLPEGWLEIGRVGEGTGVTVDGKVPKGPIGWDHFTA
jgi:thiamine-monophosphate kinase